MHVPKDIYILFCVNGYVNDCISRSIVVSFCLMLHLGLKKPT